jgi:hypothetical protein
MKNMILKALMIGAFIGSCGLNATQDQGALGSNKSQEFYACVKQELKKVGASNNRFTTNLDHCLIINNKDCVNGLAQIWLRHLSALSPHHFEDFKEVPEQLKKLDDLVEGRYYGTVEFASIMSPPIFRVKKNEETVLPTVNLIKELDQFLHRSIIYATLSVED